MLLPNRPLAVNPQEAVFIDDREDFLAGARDVGMKTVLCISPNQVQHELTLRIS